ncbi:hypothetical protein KUTeg_024018 [Tegillarca granosa]|uniref:non-specific serine/threonine protein kinase n=1 Tax=Tegillarca granosa TaxID=220873 RepID=A0ABQ9DWT6_TEGGR|nr:hypothetical protein KUTeg_024018 [Tegillarca granosa]
MFAEDQIMDWFVQICLAIKHIHDRKILHRDIKSQNIFLSGDGSVQLGDFGIAKVLNSTVELARTCIGTPYYLSPEICENRPYNNKSDIWSLGCVLYELTTLKHAFEAGNMKNLVLKIIRGSYPPVPPKYSYDLRGLIAQLFKRAPKERPSINSVLRKPFVSKKVGKFLSEQQIQDEFSHTVMHGKKVHRALPPPPVQSRPPSAGGRKPPAARPTPAAPPKYNPAAVYGAPVVRKSKDNRSSVEKKRPGSAGVARTPSAGGVRPSGSSQDLKKKRQEFMEKEKRRREDAEKAALQRKHKDLQEKQKMARINKSKEEGWKNILGSLGSGDGDKQSNGSEPVEEPARRPLPQRPDERNVPLKDRGNYDQYHAYLDKIKQDQADRARRNNPADYLVAPKPGGNSPAPQEWRRAEVGRAPAATPVGVQYQPARGSYVQQAEANRKLAEQAAERAKIVEDYLSRKRQAALNKQRGQAQLFGNAPSYEPPRNVQRYQDADQPRPSSAQSRDREEQEYLDKLRQIRQQNFMDRKGILANQQGLPDPREEAEARKKKIEALRQQADDRARQLKEQLEKQRKDIFNRDKRTPQNQENRIPPRREEVRPSVAAKPVIKPAPAVPITGALRAIGVEAKCVEEPVPAEPAVGVTGALQVIGAVEPKPVEEPAPRIKSPLQQKKEGILKKLNEKGRGKWGAPIKPAVEDKEVEQDSTPESSRSRWGQGGNNQFKQMPLEQTASQMEATSARDTVIQNPSVDSSVADSAKRQWGRPGSTVIKALEGLPVLEGTIASTTSDDSVTSPEITSKGGATITISKPPIQKGTIVIKSIDETAVQKQGIII